MIFFVVLATGFAAGLVATLLVPGRRRLSLPSTTLVGIVGAGAGLTVAELAGGGTTLARFLLAVAGSVVVLLVAETAKARFRPAPTAERPSVTELVSHGESLTLELKGSARRNQQTGERDTRLELTIAKSVAGLLNAEGGTLLIGVADDGAVVGIEGDYAVMTKGNRDGYELWLRDYLAQRLGDAGAARRVHLVRGRRRPRRAAASTSWQARSRSSSPSRVGAAPQTSMCGWATRPAAS